MPHTLTKQQAKWPHSVSVWENTHFASHDCGWLLKKLRPALTLEMDQHLYIRPVELTLTHVEL
jgi:hypothetical protein